MSKTCNIGDVVIVAANNFNWEEARKKPGKCIDLRDTLDSRGEEHVEGEEEFKSKRREKNWFEFNYFFSWLVVQLPLLLQN